MTDASAANNNEPTPEGADGIVSDATKPADGGAAARSAADTAALAAEVADLKDRLLRTLAEMENLRRRTDREVTEARMYAITGFARDMVGVADNMRRALDATRDAGGVPEGPAKSLLEGVELTERELQKTLEKHRVMRFDPQGAKFDPNFHQAMFEVPDANVPAGSVVQVVQSGYMIGDRMLRPALVGVSKGGPKAAPPERQNEKQSG
jgi:molecular chaperone GrpE